MNVVVLGASPKPDRYSNKAMRMLTKHGHHVIPVAPHYDTIENLPVLRKLSDVKEPIDTLTVYVGPTLIQPLIPDIVAAKPKRVILNPGTEDQTLMAALEKSKIPYQEACTLVLLSTGQF